MTILRPESPTILAMESKYEPEAPIKFGSKFLFSFTDFRFGSPKPEEAFGLTDFPIGGIENAGRSIKSCDFSFAVDLRRQLGSATFTVVSASLTIC